jgi:hypothetical protein
MQTLSIAIRNFNDRVKTMNQTNGRQLMLSADEARNLQSDIFALLANLAELQSVPTTVSEPQSNISLDGGGFL